MNDLKHFQACPLRPEPTERSARTVTRRSGYLPGRDSNALESRPLSFPLGAHPGSTHNLNQPGSIKKLTTFRRKWQALHSKGCPRQRRGR